jgi:hypothetical protein
VTLQAFHNDQAIKDRYLARVRAHREADNLVRGQGWENGRGCAVGCTLEAYDHSRYPTELGIPEWLARVEDTLFEGMPKKKAMLWPERFLAAIQPGVDLEKVKAPFLIFILESALTSFDHEKYPDCKKAIGDVIALWRLGETDLEEFARAAWTARAAARAAEAAEAAEAAAWAAEAAAWAARAAAWAARAATYEKFADELIRLIEELSAA